MGRCGCPTTSKVSTARKFGQAARQQQREKEDILAMEALKKMNILLALFVAILVMVANGVSAAEAPAPGPSSDATLFVPTAFASFIALAFSLLF
ncbi:hypothetical protein RJT34_21618 [Clitoria ternatea]|uniref:Uncharacterized protein n=1 Tax=Clitoria ternatea TaxID=43366 RepID=A0AAN9P6P0_CLITE